MPRALTGVALVVGLAVSLFASSSSAQTSTGPTKFKSKLYGYSLYASGRPLVLHPATSQWSENQPQPGDPDVDTLTNQVQERFFLLGAQKLPNGVGPAVASWTAEHLSAVSAARKRRRCRTRRWAAPPQRRTPSGASTSLEPPSWRPVPETATS